MDIETDSISTAATEATVTDLTMLLKLREIHCDCDHGRDHRCDHSQHGILNNHGHDCDLKPLYAWNDHDCRQSDHNHVYLSHSTYTYILVVHHAYSNLNYSLLNYFHIHSTILILRTISLNDGKS